MRVETDGHEIRLVEIDPLIGYLLVCLPSAADPGDSGSARDRLFPKPSADAETARDWEEMVLPELRALFESSDDTVRRGLLGLDSEASEPGRLRIARGEVQAWLNCLNRARLVLAERHSFGEEEMGWPEKSDLRSARDLALLQMGVYGMLQELLIGYLEGGTGSAAESEE